MLEAVWLALTAALYILFMNSHCVRADMNCTDNGTARTPWSILSRNSGSIIRLTCAEPNFYPFCLVPNVTRIIWRLPLTIFPLQLEKNQTQSGWSVSPDGSELTISREMIPKETNIAGVYECLVLAQTPLNDSLYSWYHLQWAVDYFAAESMLFDGDVKTRFSKNILYASFAGVFSLCVGALLMLVSYFSDPRESASECDGVYSSRASEDWGPTQL
ncbi:unnamed protein product [Calicophoron daubneyi]|uniref:Ig-like domain-containing protein n=1 Tax=Calicophoron daubneyi TaxID=300641 RepID=A0AAV2T381_CALDB